MWLRAPGTSFSTLFMGTPHTTSAPSCAVSHLFEKSFSSSHCPKALTAFVPGHVDEREEHMVPWPTLMSGGEAGVQVGPQKHAASWKAHKTFLRWLRVSPQNHVRAPPSSRRSQGRNLDSVPSSWWMRSFILFPHFLLPAPTFLSTSSHLTPQHCVPPPWLAG